MFPVFTLQHVFFNADGDGNKFDEDCDDYIKMNMRKTLKAAHLHFDFLHFLMYFGFIYFNLVILRFHVCQMFTNLTHPDVFVSVTSYQILYIQILLCSIYVQSFCCAVSMCGPLCPLLSLYLSMFTVYPQGGKSSSRFADRTDDIRLLAKTREHVVHSGVGDTRSHTVSVQRCQELPGSKVALPTRYNEGFPILLGEPEIAWCVL